MIKRIINFYLFISDQILLPQENITTEDIDTDNYSQQMCVPSTLNLNSTELTKPG